MKKALTAGLAAALALTIVPSAQAGTFHGVVSQGALTATDFDRMGYAEVGALRIRMGWAGIETQPGQFSWARLDQMIGCAADRGVRVLPVLVGPGPAGVAHPPVDAAARSRYAAFARAVAARYGRGGSFWSGRASVVPITAYQIANEQNGPAYWDGRPSPRAYGKLVKAAANQVKQVDPAAQIVLGGMYGTPRGVGAMTSWEYLKKLYGVRGIKRAFEAAAIHPYASTISGIKAQIKKARGVMRRAGDARAKLRITEIGFGSGTAGGGFEKGAAGQAAMLGQMYRALEAKRRKWRIAGVNWFSWQDNPTAGCSFCATSGLFTADGAPKPAWSAFLAVSR